MSLRLGTLLIAGGSIAGVGCHAGSDARMVGADAAGSDQDAPARDDDSSGQAVTDAPTPDDQGWRPLFNGVDFTGWDRYLGIPSDGTSPLGVDHDPRAVYSVVTIDGEPAVRVSGEVWGSLISQRTYCGFHLRGEYRWGSKTWPPLNAQDSGIMYLSTGPLGAVNAGGDALSEPAGSGGFMVSMEYQIAPGDEGGIYNLGPISFQKRPVAGAPAPARAAAWNQVEIIVQGGVARHLRNGEEVAGGTGFRLYWPQQPPADLTCGKLQLESEGAEVYFRRLEIQVLPDAAVPDAGSAP